MNPSTLSNQPSSFDDPRSRAGFQQQHFPLANGMVPPPIDAAGQNDRIMLEFLAAYYDLNCAHSRLVDARQRSDSSERAGAEVECLREIEKVLILRDDLEDRYAPCGTIARPVVVSGFTVNVSFSFANADSRGRPRTDLHRITAQAPIPLPPGAKLADYIIDFEGPEPFMPIPD